MSNHPDDDVLVRRQEGIEQDVESLLINFETIGEVDCALVAADASDEFKDRILAAVGSYRLGLKSIDHVRRTYLAGERPSRQRGGISDVQAEIYRAAVEWMTQTFDRLEPHRAKVTAGEFRANAVLLRLRSSFFAAHILYRLGRVIEANAVSRLILEQIAWAYGAKDYGDLKSLHEVSATFVTPLEKLKPGIGRLYGKLTSYAHLDARLHHEVMTTNPRGDAVIIANFAAAVVDELVLIELADVCAMVYEITQHRFMPDLITVRRDGEDWTGRPERAIVRTQQLLTGKACRARDSLG